MHHQAGLMSALLGAALGLSSGSSMAPAGPFERELAVEPPPWRLTAAGYVLLFHFSRAFVRRHSALEPYAGGLGAVMIVRYADSNVGPYDELLCIPGCLRGRRFGPVTISTIYVSNEASVRSARANWGIPKELATFRRRSDGVNELIRVADQRGPIATFTLSAGDPRLPFSTRLIPPRARTLAQRLDGRTLLTTLSSRGRVGPARLVAASINPERFPDVREARLLGALRVDDVELIFPPAREEAL